MAGVVGFEPTHTATKKRCLTTWPHPSNAGKLGGFLGCVNSVPALSLIFYSCACFGLTACALPYTSKGMKNLVIVESPAKSKTIEKYLGPDFKVLASYGHVRDLPSKNGSVNPDEDFSMNYQVNPDSEKNIKAIVTALKSAETLYLATDPDREGEAISWHVWEEAKNRLSAKKLAELKVHRVVFTEITKTAVTYAIKNPRDIAMSMVNAQQARRALDYLVGFNLSPVLWRKVRRGLSAGRVQSVALRLVCDREDEIDAFKPEEYWTIAGLFNGAQDSQKLLDFPAKLHTFKGKRVEKFSFTDEKTATSVVSTLNGHNYYIADVEKKQTKRRPAPPFMTSTIQQDAARRLYFSAKKTMMTAQRLYEAGHITYMRTDSVNLAQEAINGLRDAIATKYGAEYLPEKPNFYKSKQQNAQEAHEAIRPTNPANAPGSLKLEPDQAKLYQLIWQRTMACQMAPAKIDQTALVIQPKDDDAHIFRATGSVIVFPGFLKAYGMVANEDGTPANDKDVLLPPLKKGDDVDVREIKPEQHFTEPPPRYSEASLVKTLEEYGIGRPSTYAAILSTIQDRGYVRLEQRRFHPEDVGRVVTNFLAEHFETYVDYDFTANMEEELDAISRGEKDWKPTLRDFWAPFKTRVDDKIESVKKSDVTSESTGETCPTCNKGELLIRLGRFGKFKGCNNYPECKHTEPLEGREAPERAAPVDTGVQCPSCKKANMVERKSRRGKIFYSCESYPTCKYATWDKPMAKPCPTCAWPITTEKETKRFGRVEKCPQEDCDWQDPPAPAKKAGAATKTKKPAAKKTVAKKPAAKKVAVKKTAAKKTVAKKATAAKK